MTVLLLTGCINPEGMSFTKLTEKSERQRQYLQALDFYLRETSFPIVFAENSNTDISSNFKIEIKKGRLEIITFCGNQEKSKGKGYGEANIIEYALNHSALITEHSFVVKITGRLIVKNINDIVKRRFPMQPHNSIVCSFHSDLKFADSRVFCSPVQFLSILTNHKDEINDNNGAFFEHVLAKCAINSNFSTVTFRIEPSIFGISGSTGDIYTGAVTDTTHQRQYTLYALNQTIMLNKKKKDNLFFKHLFFFCCLHLQRCIFMVSAHVHQAIKHQH